MEKGRERFFHPDRGTAAPDVSGRRKQLPDGNQIGFLVTRNAGGSFQIDLVISRDDTDEMARPITTKHERLENRSNIFAELFGHVSRGQMLLIHPIRDQFVGDFGSVEQTGRIGLFYFDVPMFHSAESSSIRMVTTPNGTTVETVLVEVQELLPPLISFPMQTDGLEVVKGRKYEFAPTVQSAENSNFLWTLRRPGAAEAEPVGDEAVYEFCEEVAGTYEVTLRTENEDGSDEMTIEVEVVDALAVSATAVPIGRKYDGLTRTVSLDHTITLQPSIWNGTNPKFSWTIDGQEVGTELSYTYTPTETGIKKIVFTVTDTTDEPEVTLSKCITRTNETRATLEFTVECHGEEESHRRPASGASSATWNRVYEYTPAPGQFINELVSGGFTGTETTPEAAVAYAEKRMRKNTWVSLGGWGGYIVVGFDHSIDNSSSGYKGGYNFSITGNAFKGSSEPGIVYVMQDTNGNTLPDDEWYELKGSEFGKEETVQDYAVTYYRPTYSGADVQWKDNQGVKGKIDYLKQYHDQPSYYPAWIGTDSYTLYGPCLKSRTYDQSGNGSYWVNGEYDWGYADNFGNDRLSEDDNAAAGAMKVYFKISNAVDKNGQPANLKYIDFIRVQTGVNAKAGWLGENSTEVFGFTDENINQGK